jgi:hypothetical protein
VTTTPHGLSRRRRRLYALLAIAIAFVLSFTGLLAVDIYLHGKFEKSAGFNVWGYRGPAVGRKQADEYRVAVLGGSTAYGYGTEWNQAIPAVLESDLAGRSSGRFHRFRVVNLGYNNEGAYSFTFTMKDYASLAVDAVILYEGYNDLAANPLTPNLSVFRHESPIFRLTGYLPIFPIVFKEKAAVLAHGSASALYGEGPKTVFRAGIAARAAAGVLDATAEIGQSLERQLGKISQEAPRRVTTDASTGCSTPWQHYCRAIADAVDYAVASGKQVLVATQPYLGVEERVRQRHIDQQTQMAAMLQRRFGANPRVTYLNLGPTLDLHDPQISFDRMHLTEEGNRQLAQHLVQPVLALAAAREQTAGR